MNLKFCLALTAVIVVTCPAVAHTENIRDYQMGAETNLHAVITSASMSLFFYNPDTGFRSPPILQATITPADQGRIFTATPDTDPNFNDFLDRVRATDNANNYVAWVDVLSNGTTFCPGYVSKAELFGGLSSADLASIDSVSLKLDQFTLNTPGWDAWHDGQDTYIAQYGTLSLSAPEPSTLVLLATSLAFCGVVAWLRLRSPRATFDRQGKKW